MPLSRLDPRIITLSFCFMIFFGLCRKADGQVQEPRGEIRVVESWRPTMTVLGHNVLEYLFEYALDSNELAPVLTVSRQCVDDTTLVLKLPKGVRFDNGEPFDTHAVKFNFEYQRQQNTGRGIQEHMKNLKEIQAPAPPRYEWS